MCHSRYIITTVTQLQSTVAMGSSSLESVNSNYTCKKIQLFRTKTLNLIQLLELFRIVLQPIAQRVHMQPAESVHLVNVLP